jgi:ABC-type multidrug transport system fused ATPase/permease subunit
MLWEIMSRLVCWAVIPDAEVQSALNIAYPPYSQLSAQRAGFIISEMEDLRWLFRRIRPYIPILLLSLTGSLIQSGGATGVTLLVKGVIDEVFVFRNEEELFRIVGLLLLSAALMQGGFFLSRYLVTLASERTLRDIRTEIFRKLLYVPYSFFIRHPTGDLISRIVSDVEKVRQILVEQIPTLLREPVVGVALFGVLLYRDALLTLLLIVVVPVMAVLTPSVTLVLILKLAL